MPFGWTEELIRREETAGAIEVIAGKPRKRAEGRVDYMFFSYILINSPQINHMAWLHRQLRLVGHKPQNSS
jgi:hypothetical protein